MIDSRKHNLGMMRKTRTIWVMVMADALGQDDEFIGQAGMMESCACNLRCVLAKQHTRNTENFIAKNGGFKGGTCR